MESIENVRTEQGNGAQGVWVKMQDQGKITYHQQVTYCGKPRCRKCREGIGHGPYWYAYRMVNGQTTRTYIGKNLPPDALVTADVKPTNTGEPAMSGNFPSSIPPIDVPLLRVFTLGQFRLERRFLVGSADTSGNVGQGQGQAQGAAPTEWRVVNDAAWQHRQDNQIRTLLGYLLCCPGRRAHRSQLLALLGLEGNDETSIRRLNKTIPLLQRILGGSGHTPVEADSQAAGVSIQPLRFDDDWLVLAGQECIWVDADVFE